MKEKNLLTVLSIGQEELNHMHCIDMRCTATGFKILIFFFSGKENGCWLSDYEKECFDLILLLS